MNSAITEYCAKTFRIVLLVTFVLLFTRAFVVEPGKVNGRSMENTFIDEEVFLVNKFVLLFRAPRRGDVVQVYDISSGKLLIKRVIGLPGERIKISRGAVSIISQSGREEKIEEPYLKPNTVTQSLTRDTTEYETIQPNEYFVMGDNRPLSIDSRSCGAVHRSEINGLVMTVPFLKI